MHTPFGFTSRPRWRLLLPALAATLLLTACETFNRQQRVDRQDKAGSVHVAVLSVVPWSSYSDSLQPVFKMTAEDALAQAIPDTVALEDKLLSALGAKAKVALPQTKDLTSLVSTATTTGDSSVENSEVTKTTTTDSKTTTESPGDVSTAQLGASPAGTQTAAGLPGASVLSTKLGLDPMMRLTVAKALYQEAALINQEIKHAALDPDAYTSFLVRIQVTVLPSQRDEPYDAYSSISFFHGDFDSSQTSYSPLLYQPNDPLLAHLRTGADNLETDVLESTDVGKPSSAALRARAAFLDKVEATNSLGREAIRQLRIDLDKIPLQSTAELEAAVDERLLASLLKGTVVTPTPRILPLLVTDDIVAALQSRSTEKIAQFGLALSALFNGVGVGADLQKTSDKLRSSLGRDFNSTFTVARSSDNTMLVRFGALQQAAATYTMIPQSHYVSLVLLVPKKDPQPERQVMRLLAKTIFIDATKGTPLPSRPASELLIKAKTVFRNHGYPEDKLTESGAIVLLGHVARNDFATFVNELKAITKLAPSSLMPEATWADFAALRTGGQYDSGTFAVYFPKPNVLPFATQTPILFDDGKTVASASIQGGKGWKATNLRASLLLKEARGAGTPDLTFYAGSVSVNAADGTITLGFPSPAAAGLTDKAKLKSGVDPQIELLDVSGTPKSISSWPAVYLAKPVKETAFTLAVGSKVINSKAGSGKVLVSIGKVPPGGKITLDIDGAYAVRSPLPAGLKVDATGGLFVDADATFELALENLSPIANVVISAKDADGGTQQQVRPVLELPEKDK
jgi:hypothetical protein